MAVSRFGITLSHLFLTTLLITGIFAGVGMAQSEDPGPAVEEDAFEVQGVPAILVLLGGTVVLMLSVELLIHALVRTAVRFGVSAFLLAIIFSGWEFDNVAFGLFTGFSEMQDVAFGLAIGNAVSIFGLTLGLGAMAFPFVVDVPNDYLWLTFGAPFLLVPVLVSGTLTPALSTMFILMYIIIFAYVVQRERSMNRTFMQSAEVRETVMVTDGSTDAVDFSEPIRRVIHVRWFWPAMLLVAIGGIVVGAEVSATGAEGILATWNLTGTFLGVTVITVLFTIDDLLLIVEPLRLGYYDVAVGGVIGSLLFFVTANVGIIGLVGTIDFRWETVFVHFPALVLFAGLSVALLWRGAMSRRSGGVLLGLYVLYLLINIQYFATLPVGE